MRHRIVRLLYLFISLLTYSRLQWTYLVLVPAWFWQDASKLEWIFIYLFIYLVKLRICSDTCVHVLCLVRR